MITENRLIILMEVSVVLVLKIVVVVALVMMGRSGGSGVQ